jgi:hypothetical protein
MERYSFILDFPNYAVTSYGRVLMFKNAKSKVIREVTGPANVYLYREGKGYLRSVARLVAEHFIRALGKDEIVRLRRGKSCEVHNLEIVSRRSSRGGSSEFPGVYFCSKRNRWGCSIYVDKKKRHIGYFHTEHAAAAAYERELADYKALADLLE